MRRHERRRGARVTGSADLEGVESRKDPLLEMADGLKPSVGNSVMGAKASASHRSRDRRPDRASHKDCVVTKEIRSPA